jgi:hypothetical protein
MNKLRASIFMLLAMLPGVCRSAQLEVRSAIQFPDLPGYKTLACDFHMHTILSDGSVVPTVRVNEAWRQGLDAIALTDHIATQPPTNDLPAKYGRLSELAESAARAHNLPLIKGGEITRDTPPGHFNALFLANIKPLENPEFLEAIEQANQQGAFVFWNHHGWKGEEKGKWLDVHQTMYDKKWFQGMEIANGETYYPAAHAWCLEKSLTMMGNSDIHDPDLRKESASLDHRTMTLVFVKEQTPAGIKEALLAGRTIVWFKDQLIGREELLRPFFDACIQVCEPNVRSKANVFVEVRNKCQADICLELTSRSQPRSLVLPAKSTVLLKILPSDAAKPIALNYTAKNFLIGPGKSLPVTLRVPAQSSPGKKQGK